MGGSSQAAGGDHKKKDSIDNQSHALMHGTQDNTVRAPAVKGHG